ncbi:hypothetical protein L3Y34_019077 [Caenorhabditis briggsae]|uniref:Fork-head domain-containing protein n=1 Tax=Caenorhabditis briggsae TaxID=6238 RepID=A0AAE9DP06_CAEBR|nr:hypothetical protein L3Y34_019077 [Caenorhabditis briggsae]
MNDFGEFFDFDEFDYAGFAQEPENEEKNLLDPTPITYPSFDEEWSMDSSYQNLDVPHHSPPPSPTPRGQIQSNVVQESSLEDLDLQFKGHVQEPLPAFEELDRQFEGDVQDPILDFEDFDPDQKDLELPQFDWVDDFVEPISGEQFQQIARSQGKRTIQRQEIVFYDAQDDHLLEDDLQNSEKDETSQMVDNGGPGARIRYSNVHGPPVYNGRPPFRLRIYGAMAVINSPSQHITVSDAKNFILHHFPWFRTSCEHLKTSLATMLKTDEHFVFKSNNNHNIRLYTLKKLEIPSLLKREKLYIDRDDPRTRDFYERIFSGDVGLPREMFYRFLGNKNRLAGPENSALFYHLLAHKLDPRIFINAFREHKSVPSGQEPKFDEDLLPNGVEVQNWPYYGVALPVGAAPRVMSSEDVNAFFENIEAYYGLQKRGQEMGILNWETPILH